MVVFPWWGISFGWAAVPQQQINQRRYATNLQTVQTPDSIIAPNEEIKTAHGMRPMRKRHPIKSIVQ
jgi:hypothetical protein